MLSVTWVDHEGTFGKGELGSAPGVVTQGTPSTLVRSYHIGLDYGRPLLLPKMRSPAVMDRLGIVWLCEVR